MKTKLFVAGLIILAIVSCRRKQDDKSDYYEPYKEESQVAADSAVVVEKPVVVKETKPAIKGVDKSDNYFIVVSSYTVEGFARDQMKELIAQGYQPDIIMTDDDGWFKLAVSSFKKFDEAEAGLAKLKERDGMFSKAWIVYQKK